MLVEEQSASFNLLGVEAAHELQVHSCPDDLSSHDFGVALEVVQSLPRAPGCAAWGPYEHGRLLGPAPCSCLLAFLKQVKVPWHVVVWIIARQV